MSDSTWTERRWLLLAVLLVAAWAHFFVSDVSMTRGRGWDEAMHAELPAARMALSAGRGDLGAAARVALDCQQYPPAYPALLATAYSVTGIDELWGRRFGRLIQALGLGGLFLLGRRLARRPGAKKAREGPGHVDQDVDRTSDQPNDRRAAAIGFTALLLGLLSPMWLAYSGTFFLEGPFLTVSIFTLFAWVGRDGRRSRELLTGALITLAFFTKFNYALALGLGLFLDLAVDGVLALRSARFGAFLRRTAYLAILPVLGALWWFVLPWPGDRALGAQHFEAFTAFLSGNQQLQVTPVDRRLWDAGTFLVAGPVVGLLVLMGLLVSLGRLRQPGVRSLWIVFLASGLPVWTHNFHLDRFLLPALASALPLGAVGLATVFAPGPRWPWLRPTLGAGGLLAALLVARSSADAFARALGLSNPDNSEYVGRLHSERLGLRPGRPLPTAGLERATHKAFMDAIEAELGPQERVGWLGITSELSPGALHLALFERGGPSERLERDAARVRPDGQPEMVVTFESVDPGWDNGQLARWAEGFDLLLSTRPVDWKGRRGREFLADYQIRLLEGGDWKARPIAQIPVPRPVGEPTSVELFALRRSAE